MKKTVVCFFEALIVLLVITGCATSRPTDIRENPDRRMDASSEVLNEPIEITEKTVVVDARSPFEYSVARIPKSISLQWTDFTEREPAQRGILQRDLFEIARRLARSGIAPETPVVVVGEGLEGEGEEGRIAWMLSYLGVSNVRFADLDFFKVNLTNIQNQSAIKSVPIWKPKIDESLNVTREELLNVINKGKVYEPVPSSDGDSKVYRIIDVRPSEEYLGKKGLGAKRSIPNMDAINVPWREFFDENLMLRPEMADQLKSVGVNQSHRIIVLDEDGVSSGAVTMALRALGFSDAGNYSGGLQDLLSAYPQ